MAWDSIPIVKIVDVYFRVSLILNITPILIFAGAKRFAQSRIFPEKSAKQPVSFQLWPPHRRLGQSNRQSRFSVRPRQANGLNPVTAWTSGTVSEVCLTALNQVGG